MRNLFLLTIFIIGSCGQEIQTKCDYEQEVRTYLCKDVFDVFPNMFYGNYHLQCVDCSIKEFTNKTFPFSNSLVSFNVSKSDIAYIGSKAFSGLSNAQYIYLQDNNIVEVTPLAFEGLRQVYELHLENNYLMKLLPGFLADMEVNTVILKSNRIKMLPNGVFGGSLGILILDLSQNHIKTLEADAFASLENLEILNLEKNQICHIPLGLFKEIPTLRHLNLADNKLSKFVFGTFSGLRNLNILNLANNTLSTFDGNILIPFAHLSTLDISGNGIYYIDSYSIHVNVPTLRTLRIDDNLLSCIDLVNIIQYFKKINVEVVNFVRRYNAQNVNGIACTEIVLNHSVDFEQFLTVAKEDTKKAVTYC